MWRAAPFKEDFTDLEGATYTCSTGDHRTAADAVMAALTENQYTYTGSSTYLSGITDPNSVSLTGGDSAFGSWSGWMFTVNGEMPIERYDNGQPIYATLGDLPAEGRRCSADVLRGLPHGERPAHVG